MTSRWALLALVVFASTARADDDDPALYATVVPQSGKAPLIRITVHGSPAPRDVSAPHVEHRTRRISASALRPYTQLAESAAIVLVVDGQEIWVGNDQIEPVTDSARRPNPAYIVGAFAPLGDGLSEAQLATRFPRDSVGALVTYADRATVRVPMGPLSKLDRSALGTQRDYYTKIGSQLVDGIERGLEELARSGKQRRILVVVGDGSDTNADTARARLQALKKRAATDNVETHAIVWKGPLSADTNVVRWFTSRVEELGPSDSLRTAPRLVTTLGDRYEIDVPSDTLPRDEPITLLVHDGHRSLGRVELVLPGVGAAAPPQAGARRTWAFALGIAGLVGLALGIVALRRTSQRLPLG